MIFYKLTFYSGINGYRNTDRAVARCATAPFESFVAKINSEKSPRG